MKKHFLILTMLALGFTSFAQSFLTGTVIDADTKESIIGATIYNAKTKTGTTTDLEGHFRLEGSSGTELTVSFMGYQTEKVTISVGTTVEVQLKSTTVSIKGAEIVANVAIARKTPVAVSVISPIQIEERLGTQEFPEILKSTPGVYATKQGGGFGDSRINLRGFASENVAVMINGVPMNDMEWGGIYWSNWAGLSDVTRSMQVQRGLGASKVSAPSVGGSINIVTKSTDAVKGGTMSYGIGNDGYNKLSFSASSGLTPKGWAITLLGAKTWGNGYIQGTNFEGYSYFLNVSKQINKNQVISFTGFGAPQWHFQRYDRLLISEWGKYKEDTRFNSTYGFDSNGKQLSGNYNYYHKPQLALNHYWTIDDKSTLSTVLYTSIGRGGGYGGQGNKRTSLYGASGGILNEGYRTINNTFDYAKLIAENAADPNGSQVALSSSRNEHEWYGLLSTYDRKLNENINLNFGLDLRYYAGLHDAVIIDLLGGKFLIDPSRASKNNRGPERNTDEYKYEKLKVGDVVYRDNTGYAVQEGVFGQAEYSKDKLNAFVSGSVSNSSYWKVDRFYYDNEKSKTKNYLGFVAKGGANYNLTSNHNVFANIGYISRAPFMSGGVFLSIHTSNGMNPDAKNEKIFSKEIGYGFRSSWFSANVNLYHTNWNDKAIIRAIDNTDPDAGVANLQGVNALHQGIEIDLIAKPVNRLEIKGMVSLGDWKWTRNVEGYAYNASGIAVDSRGNEVEPLSPEHMKVFINGKGLRVGNSAQVTANLGISYNFLQDFRAGLDYTYYNRNYADFNISNMLGVENPTQPWQIPASGQLDFFARYTFMIGNLKATLNGNITNILNSYYITDASNGPSNTWETASVFYSFGRTFSLGLKLYF